MNIALCLLIAVIAALAGYYIGVSRTQREAVAAQARLAAEQKHTEEVWKKQAESLRNEFKSMSADMIRSQSESLRMQHLNSLEHMLKPLSTDIERFRNQFVTGHASLDHYIKELVNQTATLGREAEDLAKALKGNTKLQGNWGEAVLANLLAASGLTEGRDYTLQARQNNTSGKTFIPDVVIHLPEKRNLIIDSKVSLKAFTEAMAADSPEEQKKLISEHVKSVRQHVRELAAKDYARVVPDSIGYVLMFIPGEAAYVAAVTADPMLPTDAYAQHVILINPTNLLMALQLAYNLWQSELQSRSVNEIYTSAEKLYKKFSTFAQNFVKIGNSITQMQHTYDEAYKQLATGRGSIVSQLEGWKKKGLNPASNLPSELTDNNED